MKIVVSLFKYQKEAVDKLRSGSILCGGVGSGKSITALAYFVAKESGQKLCIITTAHKRDSKEWEGELGKFGLSATVDSWNNIGKYVAVKGSFFIFDEQRVVGSGAWAKSFIKIAKQNRWILLSATPGDCWLDYVPVFVANGFYKNRTAFMREHVIFSRFAKYPKVEGYLNTEKLVKLRNSVLVNMRYSKQTTVHKEKVFTSFNEEVYNKIFRDRWNVTDNEPIRDAGELCRLLRNVVNSSEERIFAVARIFKQHSKLIIFYNFNYELDMLRKFADENGIVYSEWNGHKHEQIPNGSKWLYLVQYTAGAEGWNCVQTNTVVFYSQNYSYKIMTQAAGRIDRLNTPFKDLWYYYILSRSSIDKAIDRALNEKRNFNERSFETRTKNIAYNG